MSAVELDRRAGTQPVRKLHWSESLPPGNGRSVYADIWLIPGTVAAAAVAGAVLRWWFR